MGAVFALAGCAPAEGDPCNIDKPNCPEGLMCWRVPGGNPEARCMTTAQAEQGCAKGPRCSEAGDCQFRAVEAGGICEPKTDAHCKNSAECRTNGGCALDDGVCLPKTDADCIQSEACTKHQLCKLDMSGLTPACGAPQ
jgi:hypothetical protein